MILATARRTAETANNNSVIFWSLSLDFIAESSIDKSKPTWTN